MPPQLLDKFPEKEPKTTVYAPLFDGQCWKVSPDDYDYSVSEMKQFVGSLKHAAVKLKIHIRCFVTADDHVILQKRPADYVPKRGGQKPFTT